MESNHLRQQIATIRQSFFDEAILDKYFIQLEELESRENPYFVEEVITLFFRDSAKLMATMEQHMEKTPVDFVGLERMLHQLKGSSASIGAVRVKVKTNEMREYCKEGHLEGAKASFQELKKEHEALKGKLEPYFQLLRQAGPVETAMPSK